MQFFIALALGILATGFSLALMQRIGRIDAPGARHTHLLPTPRAGALGIAVIASCFVYFHPGMELWLLAALAGIGLLDDLFPQPASLRMALQFAFCGFAAYGLGDVWPEGPIFLVRLALIMTAVWLVNAANFFDGRNGLLAGNFILFLVALPFFGVRWSMALPMAGLWLGFLPFNFPRAKIFMGDVGSYLIGATLAWLMLHCAQKSVTQLLALLVAMSSILADPTLTLILRLVQGKPVWRAHRQHLYQMWARTGLSDTKLLLNYLVYACSSFVMARWITMQPSLNACYLTALWCVFSLLLWLALRRNVLRTRRVFRRRTRIQARDGDRKIMRGKDAA